MDYKIKFISLIKAPSNLATQLDFGKIGFTGIPTPSEAKKLLVNEIESDGSADVIDWVDIIGWDNIEIEIKAVKPKMDAKVLVALQAVNHQLQIFTCDESWTDDESNKDTLEQLKRAQTFLYELETWSTFRK